MPERSAGILIYRDTEEGLEVLLVHPGGPLWRNKDIGAWQMPKVAVETGEDDETAARREVAEELGVTISEPLLTLGEIRQAGGKNVIAFASRGNVDPATIVSNLVEVAWPPGSGRTIWVPEVDEALVPYAGRRDVYAAEPGATHWSTDAITLIYLGPARPCSGRSLMMARSLPTSACSA